MAAQHTRGRARARRLGAWSGASPPAGWRPSGRPGVAASRSARLARAMGLADLHALIPVLAAAGEKSKTAFYISGGLLAVWAVVVSVFGITRPDFPHNITGSRGVMGVSALLVASTIGLAVATSSSPPKSNEAKASPGGAQAQAPPSGPAPAAGGGAAAATLAIASDPTGQLKFDRTSLAAKAGA